MIQVISFVLGVLVYPGLVVALIAAWVLGWIRESARGALNGGEVAGPMRAIGELRSAFERESIVPEGAQPAVLTVATTAAVLFPLLALVLLPVPGNPLVSALGLAGDLAAEGALLLGLPLTRLFLGWAIPSPYARLAADRGVRLLAGAALPMALALSANAQQFGHLSLLRAKAAPAPTWLAVLAYVLAAAAFACVLPALARVTALRQDDGALDQIAGELTELSGRDLVYMRLAEAVQLVAVAAFFIAAFILPLLPNVRTGVGLGLLWIGGIVVVAAGIGAWEGTRERAASERQRSPLDWWSSWPLLLALAALVAAAWATRGT